ncbi:U8 snoRNA-decapping enzyme isoform X2 [Gouania willdenowi]|nr:U8 snoRNA-decapping enzyme-like isoform X2 [Gouania willdenowi]XP_028309197.1 U8 snoRNA-decapping enzyme-like isoform X2 [Gouania willdenowi]
MQMRFDGLLGFSGGFVNLSKESLEEGLRRELSEELGVDITISEEHHVDACFSPTSSLSSSSRLILHFYVKKMEEEEIRKVEQMASSTAADHGQEVLGMVRVPLYTLKDGSGLATFLSHSFVGNARSQLINSLQRFNLVPPQELHKALSRAMEINSQTAMNLQVVMT